MSGLLRKIRDSELSTMLAWRNHPDVRKNMYNQHEISLDEHLNWWQRTRDAVNHRYFMFEEQGQPQGIVAFTGIDPNNCNSSWAFYASPDAPRGTGSKMELLALDYAFDQLQLHKLCCEVLAFNEPVIKLHQKFGFQVEGVLRAQYRHGEKYVDIVRLGILAHEWLEKRDAMRDKIHSYQKR